MFLADTHFAGLYIYQIEGSISILVAFEIKLIYGHSRDYF